MKVKVNFSSYLLNLFQVTVINHLWFLDDPRKIIFLVKSLDFFFFSSSEISPRKQSANANL